MNTFFFQRMIMIFGENKSLVLYMSIFIALNVCFEYYTPDNIAKPGDQCKHDLRNNYSSDVFLIDDMDNIGKSKQQNGIAVLANANSITMPEYIVSFTNHAGIYGEQSMNVPFGLSSYESLYKNISSRVDRYPLRDSPYRAKIIESISTNPRYYTIVKQASDSISARFIFIDTPSLVDENERMPNFIKDKIPYDDKIQLNWLKNVLENAKEKWIFVVGHHPICSASSNNISTMELMDKIKPLLEHYHVDFYLSSSRHNFEHSQLKRSSVEYIASGSNVEEGEAGKNDNTIFSSSIPGFTLVSISNRLLKIFFVTNDGKVIYSLKRMKKC